jgi:hypothetical protein
VTAAYGERERAALGYGAVGMLSHDLCSADRQGGAA